MTFQPAGRQRQHRIEPVQGLNRGLFVHDEHHRVLWRIDIQGNDVGRFALKLWIIGGHVALDTMRLEASTRPHPRHHHMADPQLRGQFAAAPVGRTVAGPAPRPLQNPGLQAGGTFVDRAAQMARIKPCQPLSQKPSLQRLM
jgi:hypothetical protein